jgi:hypothetical protein
MKGATPIIPSGGVYHTLNWMHHCPTFTNFYYFMLNTALPRIQNTHYVVDCTIFKYANQVILPMQRIFSHGQTRSEIEFDGVWGEG